MIDVSGELYEQTYNRYVSIYSVRIAQQHGDDDFSRVSSLLDGTEGKKEE
jgi:hypothetical protein